MKILHILNSIEYSGAEIMLKDAGAIYINKGFDLHALSTGDTRGAYVHVLETAGYSIYHIPFRKSARYFIELYLFLKEGHFDIVHIHPERAFFWHSLIAKLVGIKRIFRTVHSNFAFSGYLRLKRTLQRYVACKFFSVRFVTVSPAVYESERKQFFNHSILIPNWVDENKFTPAESSNEVTQLRGKLGISPYAFAIVSIGACIRMKRHDDIIVACATLSENKEHIVYLHVGGGPSHDQEKELATRLGISEKVLFLGQIENIREVLAASDLFVMSSDYEGSSIAKLEAMCCGLPIVVYDNPGVRDFVADGENGFLVHPNPHALAETLRKLVKNKNTLREIGMRARETALQHFNMEKSLGELMDLYSA